MKTTAVILSAPKELSLRQTGIRAPAAGDLVVEIAHSGISTGTVTVRALAALAAKKESEAA